MRSSLPLLFLTMIFTFSTASASGVGVGFGQVFHALSSGTRRDPDPSIDHGWSASAGLMRSNQLRLVDDTGILLALVGNAGSEYSAEYQARQEAIREGAKEGDRYTYTYNVSQPAPGMSTTLDFGWGQRKEWTKHPGKGAKDLKMSDGEVDFFEVNLSVGLTEWDWEFANASLYLGGRWIEYDFTNGKDKDGDFTVIDMPIGLNLSRQIAPDLYAAVGGDIQILSTLLGPFLNDHWLSLSGSGQLIWNPISFLVLNADLKLQRLASTEGSSVVGVRYAASGNAALVF